MKSSESSPNLAISSALHHPRTLRAALGPDVPDDREPRRTVDATQTDPIRNLTHGSRSRDPAGDAAHRRSLIGAKKKTRIGSLGEPMRAFASSGNFGGRNYSSPGAASVFVVTSTPPSSFSVAVTDMVPPVLASSLSSVMVTSSPSWVSSILKLGFSPTSSRS